MNYGITGVSYEVSESQNKFLQSGHVELLLVLNHLYCEQKKIQTVYIFILYFIFMLTKYTQSSFILLSK